MSQVKEIAPGVKIKVPDFWEGTTKNVTRNCPECRLLVEVKDENGEAVRLCLWNKAGRLLAGEAANTDGECKLIQNASNANRGLNVRKWIDGHIIFSRESEKNQEVNDWQWLLPIIGIQEEFGELGKATIRRRIAIHFKSQTKTEKIPPEVDADVHLDARGV